MQLIHLTMYDYVSGIKSKVSSTGFEILVKKLEILAGNLNFKPKWVLFHQKAHFLSVKRGKIVAASLSIAQKPGRTGLIPSRGVLWTYMATTYPKDIPGIHGNQR